MHKYNNSVYMYTTKKQTNKAPIILTNTHAYAHKPKNGKVVKCIPNNVSAFL